MPRKQRDDVAAAFHTWQKMLKEPMSVRLRTPQCVLFLSVFPLCCVRLAIPATSL